MDFAHLHVHSHYSVYHGLPTPEELVSQAKKLGFKSLALTDYGVCGGFIKFSTECKKVGIKPIFGLETHVVPDMNVKEKGGVRRNFVLLAKNRTGYKNLLKISSEAYITGFYHRPRIDLPFLSNHAEGLICSTSNMSGVIPSMIWENNNEGAYKELRRYKEIFGDNFYAEMMRHEYTNNLTGDEMRVMATLFKMAHKLDIRCYATNDVRYCRREQAKAHDVVLCLDMKRCYKDPSRFSMKSDDFYMKSTEEMAALFPNHPELLSNAAEVAESIEDDVMEMGGNYVPGAHISGGRNPLDFLRDLVYDGMKAKGIADRPEYVERVEFELKVFDACGYVLYFLVLWDFINNARTSGIRIGPGRGSAAGSLCLYALGVTALDPIKYELLFERFLSVDTVYSIGADDFGMGGA